jgi:AcrR family transcriptional regulator
MSEQLRSTNGRTYEMRKRADDVARTRQRIVEATVRLHGTVGPAGTTIAGIAAEAGVTRLTVYRHFPDDEALFAACSAHWLGQQVLPDPDRWREFDDAEQRLRFGLADLYRFYRDGQPMLRFVYRDRELLPAPQREELERQDALFSELLLAPFAVRGARRRLVSAAVAHAIAFGTWQSLCADQGLTNDEAVKALVTLVIALRCGTA